MRCLLSSAFLCLFCLVCAENTSADVRVRLKWTGSVFEIPDSDLINPITGPELFDQSMTLRVDWEHRFGKWSLLADPYFSIVKGESIEVQNDVISSHVDLENPDARKRFELSKYTSHGGDSQSIIGLNRFALRYQDSSTALTIGRQALTWGSGIVFNPLDMFNPFSLTAVDRDYKTGADLVLFEKLFEGGNELQALYIARRDPYLSSSKVSTTALKWHAFKGDFDYEFVVGVNYEEQVFGAMMRFPFFGSLIRTDLLSTCDDESCVASGMVNIDRALTIGKLPIYVFAEVFHSGYGEKSLSNEIVSLPLLDRIGRGELFTLMRDYLAFGANSVFHAQWSSTVSVVSNLNDRSGQIQTFFTYEPSDASRVQFGVILPVGNEKGEFGQREIVDDMTSGGGANAFVSFAYYL